MTDKRFQLHISKPCNEDWTEMKPTACGRFCDSCEKQVVDFTNMNEEQVLLFFKENKEKVCARLRNDQLGEQSRFSGRHVPWFRYILRLIIPFALFSCNDYGVTMGEAIPVPENNQPGIDKAFQQNVLHDSVGTSTRQTDSSKAACEIKL